jgi:ABC-type phosphate transport system substrate-binding protein
MKDVKTKLVIAGSVLWACSALATEVVTHPAVPMDQLTVTQLRGIYSMRQQNWPDGTAVRVFVLPAKNQVHHAFAKEKLQMFPYQLDRIWQKITYSGLGAAPVVLTSEQQMREMVATTEGAIGYIENSDELSKLKVIRVTQ